MLFMLDMKVCRRGGRDRMRKLSVILVGMMASLLLAHLAWPGEIEVLYEGQWKILKTELVSGREYVPLAQVAKITGGGVLRDGLRVNGVTFRLVEGEPGGVVGDTTFLPTAPPVQARGGLGGAGGCRRGSDLSPHGPSGEAAGGLRGSYRVSRPGARGPVRRRTGLLE